MEPNLFSFFFFFFFFFFLPGISGRPAAVRYTLPRMFPCGSGFPVFVQEVYPSGSGFREFSGQPMTLCATPRLSL